MIKIVTDSTGYLPQEIMDQHNIRVVPLNVHFEDGSVYTEGIDLSNKEFYRKLVASKTLPTTSQPSPAAFREVFEELTRNGDQVICTVISTKMSGTYQSAIEARRSLPSAEIAVIDSKMVAGGLGLLTLTAAEMSRQSYSMPDIVAHLEKMKEEIRIFFTVDTLEYLHKGGRIGGASAMLGTLLKVKPILTIQDGIVQPVDKVRSRARALQRIIDELAECAQPGQPAKVVVMHALVPEDADILKDGLQKRLNCTTILLTELGSIVGTHAGPGVIGGAVYPMPVFVSADEAGGQEAAVPTLA